MYVYVYALLVYVRFTLPWASGPSTPAVSLLVPKHNRSASPMLQLANVSPRHLDEAMSFIVGVDALDADKPRRSATLVNPLEAVPQQQAAEPFALELWADAKGGEVPGGLAAGRSQDPGLGVLEGAEECAGGVLV